MSPELAAFSEADFQWTRHLQSVWHDPPFNVEDINKPVIDMILRDFRRLAAPASPNRPGRVIVGPAGSGKTHLIGNLRRRVWEAGGWFVLLDIVGITDFWRTAALGFINSLYQPMPDGKAQHEAVFLKVLRELPRDALKAVAAEEGEFRRGDPIATADRFTAFLRRAHPNEGQKHRDVLRAFLLLRDDDTSNSAYSWLQGLDVDPAERARLRFAGPPPHPAELVRGMSWVMSLAGPTIIAADQLDAIVTAANMSAGLAAETSDDTEMKARSIIETLAGGLMDMQSVTSRSMTVITCLQPTWSILKHRSIKAATERFQDPIVLEPVKDKQLLTRIVGDRLQAAYTAENFTPPYATWPFLPKAIESAEGLPIRQILIRCEGHRQRCEAAGKVSECLSLVQFPPEERGGPPADELNDIFERKRGSAQLANIREPDNDNKALRDLVADALALYVRQTPVPEEVDLVIRRDPDERRPTLHGRLVFTFHAENDREQHFCFRVLSQSHHIAFQARLRAAMTAAGIDAGLAFRHLVIIRQDAVPTGRVTEKLVTNFLAAGGRFIAPSDDDLRTFAALRDMAQEHLDGFDGWLRVQQPLCDTALFKEAGLCPPPLPAARTSHDQGSSAKNGADQYGAERTTGVGVLRLNEGDERVRAVSTAATLEPENERERRDIPVGRRLGAGGECRFEVLGADLLPRHMAILAGAGSGKTVLLRRVIEEAALLGIPAIVLDSNNDLARLGDPWPDRPEAFSDDDARKADEYFHRVQVLVWTPGLSSGKPMSLSLLPDFSFLEEGQDREEAIGMAVATLLPFVGATGAKGPLKEGVLADSLRHFARGGGSALIDLISLLSELPDDVSRISGSDKLAGEMANRLQAAISTNPLLRAQGQNLDPAVLFHGTDGQPRISVINLSWLTGDAAKQAFVNQLQMALFSWIKLNPSPTGRLYVMDEAQNFAPSESSTPSKASALALVAQGRKYGLGMIFATQVPKGIDNVIVGNCTTHFYGKQSAPATIQAAKEMMAAKGGGGDDIGRLTTGQFYFATEGTARPFKLKTPLCLTYHPKNPLVPEEVEARARRSNL